MCINLLKFALELLLLRTFLLIPLFCELFMMQTNVAYIFMYACNLLYQIFLSVEKTQANEIAVTTFDTNRFGCSDFVIPISP